MNKKNKLNKLNNVLEIPKEVYSNLPLITIIGFEEITIENVKGILEYEEYFLKTNTEIGVILIYGVNLDLQTISESKIKVQGKIEKIEMEEKN